MWNVDEECSRDLSAQIERLEMWLRSTLGAPPWRGVALVESFWLKPTMTSLSHAAIVTPERYAARFAELMSAGYAWINFHAAGVLGGRLLISVEWPPGGPTGAPRTSIQLSGPFTFAAERVGWSIDDLVAITSAASAQVVMRRVRNRIIEYLELASSFDEQRAYQRRARVSVPPEVINQWEDLVDDPRADWLRDPAFSEDERQGVADFHATWEEVSARTPDPLPELEVLFGTPEWQRLRLAAANALGIFARRGKLSEDSTGGPRG
jgi:hypothetical protein